MTSYTITVDLKDPKPKSEIRDIMRKALNHLQPNAPLAISITKVGISERRKNGSQRKIGEMSFASEVHLDRIALGQRELEPEIVTDDDGETQVAGFMLKEKEQD